MAAVWSHAWRKEAIEMTLTLTDLFCGAGGSNSGAIQVPGVEVRMAALEAADS
jgi:hypothetical protein